VAIVAILAILAIILYAAMAAVLLDEIDTGLRSRAATIAADLPGGLHVNTPNRGLVEQHEALTQVIRPDGQLLQTSPPFDEPLLPAPEVPRVDRPTFLERHVRGVADGARLLALPVGVGPNHYVVIVGSSMSDRADALRLIQRIFLLGGPVALVLACA